MMKARKKSKRVSWASGAHLRQVKLFHPADRPSKVGSEVRNHPQSGGSHPNLVVSDGCPASYVSAMKNRCPANQVNKKVLTIPQIQWKTPHLIALKSNWQVAAGEESEEAEVQKDRETTVLEAVYPRHSAIPPSSVVSLNVEDQYYDDRYTPVIPTIPIEEAAFTGLPSPNTAPNINLQPPNLLKGSSEPETLKIPPYKSLCSPGPSNQEQSALQTLHSLEGEPLVAAAAAAAAIMKNNEPGCLIDPELLVKFLGDPNMTQKLINEHGLAANIKSGTSEPKLLEPRFLMPSSEPRLKLNNDSSMSANCVPKTILRPWTVNLSSAAPMKAIAAAATTETGIASGPEPVKPSVPLVSSTPNLASKNSMNANIQPVNGRNVAAPWRVGQSAVANTENGRGSRSKQLMSSGSLPSSNPDLLCKKSTSDHFQPASDGNQDFPQSQKPFLAAKTETGTGSRPKLVAPSVSLLSSTSDQLSKKSAGEHTQLISTGSVNRLTPVTQSLATNTESGRSTTTKPRTLQVSLPGSTLDLASGKSTSVYRQHDTGKVVVMKPAVAQSEAANSETGPRQIPGAPPSQAANTETRTGPRQIPGAPPVSLPRSNSNLVSNKFTSGKSQPGTTENVTVPRPTQKSLTANKTTRIGFRVKPQTPSLPFSGIMPNSLSNKSNSENHQPANIGILGPVTENQQLSLPRTSFSNFINAFGAPHAGPPPNFGPLQVANSGPLVRSNFDMFRAKKLIDEHGAHDRTGNTHVSGIKALFPIQPKPGLDIITKVISQHRPQHNLQNFMPTSEPLMVPLAQKRDDTLAIQRANLQPTQHFPAAFGTPPFSAPITPPPLKDINYYKTLIKQHGKKQDNSQCNPHRLQGPEFPQNPNAKELDAKYQKPCLYFNSSKGCRNGSRCLYQHDISQQWRSGSLLEVPGAKRMKLGGELAGRT